MNLPLNSLLDRNDPTENARYNMVQQQVRPWNVDGERLLDALYTVRREDFTPPAHYSLAFMDVLVPLTEGAQSLDKGECMFQPRVEARMINDVDVQPTDHVLEIGTGSGYSAVQAGQGSGDTGAERRAGRNGTRKPGGRWLRQRERARGRWFQGRAA